MENYLTSKIALFIDEHSVSPFPCMRQLETGSRSEPISCSTLIFSASRQNKMLSPKIKVVCWVKRSYWHLCKKEDCIQKLISS